MVIASGGLMLAVVLIFLSSSAQSCLREFFYRRPNDIFQVPFWLTIFAAVIAWHYQTLNCAFLCFAGLYTFLPVLIISNTKKRLRSGLFRTSYADFLVILMLWLPIEYVTGNGLLHGYLQKMTHIAGWGTAVILGLFLFLILRDFPGMKYHLPNRQRDLLNIVVGLGIAIPCLILLGRLLSFITPPHVCQGLSVKLFIVKFFAIFAGIALPEEILFRALIQNWIMQRFGYNNKSLLAAAVIFGSSHLNNHARLTSGVVIGFPNWRYAAIATVAGLIYGKVFQKSSSIFSSAGLHAFVNTMRHSFFV